MVYIAGPAARAWSSAFFGGSARGHEQVGAAIGRGNHHGDRSGHAGELRDAAIEPIPNDLHLHIGGGACGRAATTAAGGGILGGRGFGLRFGIDIGELGSLSIGMSDTL